MCLKAKLRYIAPDALLRLKQRLFIYTFQVNLWFQHSTMPSLKRPSNFFDKLMNKHTNIFAIFYFQKPIYVSLPSFWLCTFYLQIIKFSNCIRHDIVKFTKFLLVSIYFASWERCYYKETCLEDYLYWNSTWL